MSSIDEAAADVAGQLAHELGPHADQSAHERDFTIAHAAAVRMAIRLNKCIDADDWLDRTLAFQSRAVEIAQAHNQVIVLAGYAAFFTLWSSMASSIAVPAMLASGAFMAISAAVFIGWTVRGMFLLRTTSERQLALYRGGPVDFPVRQSKTEKANLADRDRLMRHWPAVVWSAAGTAGVAAAILVCASVVSFVDRTIDIHAAAAPTKCSGRA